MIEDPDKYGVALAANTAVMNMPYWGSTVLNNCLPVALEVLKQMASRSHFGYQVFVGHVAWPALAADGYSAWEVASIAWINRFRAFARNGGPDPGGWHAWVENTDGDRIDAALHNTLSDNLVSETLMKSQFASIGLGHLPTEEATKAGLLYQVLLKDPVEVDAFLYFVVQDRNRRFRGLAPLAPVVTAPAWLDR